MVSLVSFKAMAGKAIFLRVYCDGAEPEFSRSTEDADGDFATVGDKEFLLDGHVELCGRA
jgi:hypothetical protein